MKQAAVFLLFNEKPFALRHALARPRRLEKRQRGGRIVNRALRRLGEIQILHIQSLRKTIVGLKGILILG
ncbi:MAG: hypothetical protein HYU73_21465 [Betaproteobacteria bacterium]|nr:hypothetical protein [Betaproteobacteria bacterium]